MPQHAAWYAQPPVFIRCCFLFFLFFEISILSATAQPVPEETPSPFIATHDSAAVADKVQISTFHSHSVAAQNKPYIWLWAC